jgi:hypothetical protein
MAASSRRKGLAGEAEVAAIWRRAGLDVRGLEGQGDHLVSLGNGRWLHLEVKRQERLQLWQWLAQAVAEAPPDAFPVVAFRRSRGEWYAALPLADLIALVKS